ncbi:MAG: MerR family transcriptional regulator [Hyphomonadaceae bacterium]|nr:MerR family transcriptional regulator [Hyphomonadaceae bacterium]MBC6411738.1 MerR family transcriptional regulator [Hyphomonadaceae bacterium]
MQSKTTRAFRTIGEAGEELGLQPHVLRFWESKFPNIKPIKRGGGRRFYRPEDIEFLRGIKVLLHEEKHSIRDAQTLIRRKGAAGVVDLGRSVEQAAQPRDIKDTVLIPERIQSTDMQNSRKTKNDTSAGPTGKASESETVIPQHVPGRAGSRDRILSASRSNAHKSELQGKSANLRDLEDALTRIKSLKVRWEAFIKRNS